MTENQFREIVRQQILERFEDQRQGSLLRESAESPLQVLSEADLRLYVRNKLQEKSQK